MNLVDAVRREVGAAIDTLDRRITGTTDEQEKRTLAECIDALRAQQVLPERATLLDAASSIATVTKELEKAVGAARLGPFNGHLTAIEEHLARLNRLSGRIHAREALPTATANPARGGAPKRPRRPRARTREPAAPGPLNSTRFADLKDEYAAFFERCVVRPQFQPNVSYYVKRLRQGEASYRQVEGELGIAWPFVGVIHAMECGFNFYGHLHNGDPLTARTVHVPRGRPASGDPPYTWMQSALDALRLKKLEQVTDWSVPHMLFLLEGYNGFGYRRRGVPTPYLWSFSNIYASGKFVLDGKFDPNAVSKQCGAALMLKAVLNMKQA
jgi:lysozyme family protein